MGSKITFWSRIKGLLSTIPAAAGYLPTANLGSGTASSSTYLRGDQTHANFATDVAATAAVTANTAKVSNATHTGDVTGSTVLTIANQAVTLAMMANVASGTVFYRRVAGSGVPQTQTLATMMTDMNLSGTNTGDQTINSLVAAANYTIAVGTTGTDVAVSSSGSTITINIPSASASARGVVTTGTQTFGGIKTFDSFRISGTTDVVTLEVQPYSAQTANTQNWRSVGGGLLSYVDVNGFPVFRGSLGLNSSFHTAMWQGGAYGWASTSITSSAVSIDTAMYRDGSAGAIGVRSGATPHAFYIYNTYTSSTVYERGVCGFVSNVFTIGSYANGGGFLRDIMIGVSGNKVGFYGATPIARPTTSYSAATFVANSGTAVNDASTFDGYTLKQVVAALRGAGLLT